MEMGIQWKPGADPVLRCHCARPERASSMGTTAPEPLPSPTIAIAIGPILVQGDKSWALLSEKATRGTSGSR